MAAVAQSSNQKVGGSILTLATQKLVKLTAGGVSVHLLAMAMFGCPLLQCMAPVPMSA